MTDGSSILSKLENKYYEKFKKQYNPRDYIPTLDELFEILKYSNDIKNILGCCTIDVNFKNNLEFFSYFYIKFK